MDAGPLCKMLHHYTQKILQVTPTLKEGHISNPNFMDCYVRNRLSLLEGPYGFKVSRAHVWPKNSSNSKVVFNHFDRDSYVLSGFQGFFLAVTSCPKSRLPARPPPLPSGHCTCRKEFSQKRLELADHWNWFSHETSSIFTFKIKSLNGSMA